MEWFRMYHNVLHDPKIQLLPIDCRWRWVEMLCLCSQNDPRGILPALEDVAFHLRISVTETTAVIQRLMDAGLIDKCAGSRKLRMHKWENYQFASDDSYERVKRFRKQKRNVSETPPDSDTDTDTERERKGKERPPPHACKTFDIKCEQCKKDACITQAGEKWGASNGESVVNDLLRTFSPDIVMEAMDQCWNRFQARLVPAYLRKCCEGKFQDHASKNGKA
jgi:hypothetical protein